jgi:hypothetical protein
MFEAIASLISRMRPEDLFGLLIPLFAICGAMIVGIFALALKHLRILRESTLKQEMVARGMSADDIERVLSGKSSRSFPN